MRRKSKSNIFMASLDARCPAAGFSLLQMALIVMILGIMAAGAAAKYKVYQKQNYLDMTAQNQAVIENALASYASTNNALPCPADPKLLPSDTHYGVSVYTTSSPSGDCSSLAATTPALIGWNSGAATAGAGGIHGLEGYFFKHQHNGPPAQTVTAAHGYTSQDSQNAWVWVGAVPAKTLGISTSYMAEPSGNLFWYAVTNQLTNTNSLTNPTVYTTAMQTYANALSGLDSSGVTIPATSCYEYNTTTAPYYSSVTPPCIDTTGPGAIDIVDASNPSGGHSDLTANANGMAAYMIISPGKDGYGSYTLSGVQHRAGSNGGCPTGGSLAYQNCQTIYGLAGGYGNAEFLGGTDAYSNQ